MLTLYWLSHRILQTKKPFTWAEKVIGPALQVVSKAALDKKTESKLHNVPLLDIIGSRRGFLTAEDLLEQLLHKIETAPCYGLQLDESTDVGSRAPLLVYFGITDVDSLAFVDEYLYSLDLGVNTTAEQPAKFVI